MDGLLPVQRGGLARDRVAAAQSEGCPDAAFVLPKALTLDLAPGLILFVTANMHRLLIPQLTGISIDDWLIPHTFAAGLAALLNGSHGSGMRSAQ